jgi:hypothetical protein
MPPAEAPDLGHRAFLLPPRRPDPSSPVPGTRDPVHQAVGVGCSPVRGVLLAAPRLQRATPQAHRPVSRMATAIRLTPKQTPGHASPPHPARICVRPRTRLPRNWTGPVQKLVSPFPSGARSTPGNHRASTVRHLRPGGMPKVSKSRGTGRGWVGQSCLTSGHRAATQLPSPPHPCRRRMGCLEPAAGTPAPSQPTAPGTGDMA